MYIPPKYENKNLDEVRDFLKQNAFGILVNTVDGRPWATHIPLELDTDEEGRDVLVGHIAKANPQWRSFKEEERLLCIFNGPHTYVSSSWYQQEEVPTWNYIAVHIYGTLRILDQEAVLESLKKLVDKYERNSDNPISVDRLSPKTMRQIRGVVGFNIIIEEIQAAYKLSQGREQDHPEIIRHLEKGPEQSRAVAKAMKDKQKLP
ncbi:FMN-binding negative transcriptional regulator [Poritiphilus flavus]|uniref:FMN-binding negative transcriptional regulator n=1 Tax=Poritiphilus flavus TaxID=2697053 RepID=A0A6L9EA04_9FLAO|nr:FMN-binding negative transcriptional regulator [Poritiphilus flavus]NAS11595.1 FMN-binding negative transcriptional regulator [Poritiphilus flavus]